MDWHRTIVSLLLAVSTVMALFYMSTLEPELRAQAPLPAQEQPEGNKPAPAGVGPRYADSGVEFAG